MTKERLKNGLINLLDDKAFSECTVGDIVESAEVSKRSFYTYYKDKHDLLLSIENVLLKNIKHTLLDDREVLKNLNHIPDAEEISKLAGVAFNHTIKFCNQNKKAFDRLLSKNGDINFYQKLIKVGYHEFDMRFPYLFMSDYDPDSQALTLNFIRTAYVNGIIETLLLWIKNYQLISVDDLKRLLGLIQTKSSVELIDLYKTELEIIKKRNLLL